MTGGGARGNGQGAREDCRLPSARRPVVPSVLRPAHQSESQLLTDIAHASKRHWGYPEAWIREWKDELTVTPEFVAEHDVVVCERGGEVVGMFALVVAEDHVELEHFWVLPGAMGQGVGRSMFAGARARAAATGRKKMRIVSDPNAVGFYQSLGGTRIGVHSGSVCGNERELPILMVGLP